MPGSQLSQHCLGSQRPCRSCVWVSLPYTERRNLRGKAGKAETRVSRGGPQAGPSAGAGQDPGETHSQHLWLPWKSLSRAGLHLYVCVSLIFLLDSMCSFTRSLIFQPISTVVNILELHTASASNKTRIFHMAKRAPAHLFSAPCPHSLCPGHSRLSVPQ